MRCSVNQQQKNCQISNAMTPLTRNQQLLRHEERVNRSQLLFLYSISIFQSHVNVPKV